MIALSPATWTALCRELPLRVQAAGPDSLISLSVELPPGREDWLTTEASAPFCYWAVPAEGDYRLGLGVAVRLRAERSARFAELHRAFSNLAQDWSQTDAAPLAFLGFSFDDISRGDFPSAELTVPAVLLLSQGGRCRAVFSCLARHAQAAPQSWIAALQHAPARQGNRAWWRRATPFSDRMWLSRVEAALSDIAAGRLAKVVLSRSAHLIGRERFNCLPLLAALLAQHDGGTVFAAGEGNRSFLGLTPERLVSLSDGEVQADALAGSAWQEDGEPSPMPLLCDDKNRREQSLVVAAVQESLAPLCRSLQVPAQPSLAGAAKLHHLRTTIEGQAQPGVHLLQLLAALHPTPAVGGMPNSVARDWLRRHGEERGDWYTGGVGWLTPEGEGEIRVALRCASLNGRTARLYAGAGIVTGSRPEQELAETEAKFGTMLDAFERYRHEAAPLPEAACRFALPV